MKLLLMLTFFVYGIYFDFLHILSKISQYTYLIWKESKSVIFSIPFNHCYLFYTPRFKFHPTTHSSHPEGEKGAPSSSDIANPVFFPFMLLYPGFGIFLTNTFLPHFAFYVFTNFRVKRSPPVLKGYLTLARNGVKLCELSFFAQFPWIFLR